MGTWVDNTPAPKTPQTWVGLLTASLDHEDALRDVVLGGPEKLGATVTKRTDDGFNAIIEYGPVKGANKRDISRVLEKAEVWFDLAHIETRKEA